MKPCPFCGSSDLYVRTVIRNQDLGFEVWCKDCKTIVTMKGVDVTLEWNRRAKE